MNVPSPAIVADGERISTASLPVTPDFALIAQSIAVTLGAEKRRVGSHQTSVIEDQLRAIWNRRGAADVVAIESELAQIGVKATVYLTDTLRTAVHELDG